MYHKGCRVVADLSQSTEFLFCDCFVIFVRTRPKAAVLFGGEMGDAIRALFYK